MNRLFLVLFIILVFALVGCRLDNKDESNTIQDPEVTEESNKVDDFEVTLKTEKDEELDVIATITYLGVMDKIDIYHGGSIFFFNIYQKDGDFEYIGAMDLPLLKTTLIRNEPYKVEFTDIILDDLEPGTYEFQAIADYSLDEKNIVNSKVRIPVSTIIEIK